MVIRMLKKFSDNFNKEVGNMKMYIETIEKNRLEMKNTVSEMKNML